MTAAIIFSCLLALSYFLGRKIFVANASLNRWEKWPLALAPINLITLAGLFYYKIEWSVFVEQNWIRLQRTIAWSMGFPLYSDPHSGPVMTNIYGPISALAYLPAALANNPGTSVKIACLTGIIFVFAPALWLFIRNAGKDKRQFLFGLTCFAGFSHGCVMLSSIKNAAFNIHADAPTLGLCTLAILFLVEARDRNHHPALMFLSACSAIMAVWSKQVAVPIVISLPLYILVADGLKIFIRYIICFFIAGILVSGICLVSFDTEKMLYHMFSIPSKHPLKPGGFPVIFKAVTKLIREWPVALVLGFFSVLPALFKLGKTSFRSWAAGNNWLMIFFTAVLMLPICIYSNIKVGGSNNTFSYANFFMLLAASAPFGMKTAGKEAYTPETILKMKRASIFIVIFLVCLAVPNIYYRAFKLPKMDNFADRAYQYALTHPGKSYFPRLTLVNLFAERKLYHAADGLMDFEWAGMPVSTERFRENLPETIDVIGFPQAGENHRYLLPLPEFSDEITGLDELPHFEIYRRKQS